MQNQKTKPVEMPENLPILTEQEQKLIEALGQGLNNSAAYRAAYGAQGYSDAALRVRACRKVAEPDIQAHLRALQAVGFANSKLTLDERISDELAFARRAEDAGNYGAAGGAHDRVNKLLGLYVERMDVTLNDPERILDEIRQILPDFDENRLPN